MRGRSFNSCSKRIRRAVALGGVGLIMAVGATPTLAATSHGKPVSPGGGHARGGGSTGHKVG